LLGRVNVGQSDDWTPVRVSAKKIRAGVHDIFVSRAGAEPVDVDWISFR